jgi:hypothetical protein
VTNGTWNATLDLSGVQTGSYRLAAADGRASDSVAVTVAEDVTAGPDPTASESTPAEGSTTADAASTPTDAATATTESEPRGGVTTAAASSPTTSTTFPGFGVSVGLGAVVVVVTALVVGSWSQRRRR